MRATPTDHPLRILVVDDCPDNRGTLSMLLLAWGYEVRTASDGPSAVEAFGVFRPQVVLLDIGMPGVNGWEVGRLIRRQEGPSPLLVAVTGYGMELDKARSREAGFDAHLTKPADLEELQRLLETAAGRFSQVEAA